MENKLMKYGLGVYAPVTPESLLVFGGRAAEIEVTQDGETKLRVESDIAKLIVRVAAGARVTLTEELVGRRDVSVRLSLGERAVVTYVSEIGGPGACIDRTAALAAGASLDWRERITGAAFARVWNHTWLEGEGSRVSVQATFAGAGQDFIDLWHEASHLAPRTESDLRLRGVLDGSARAIVRGRVGIGPGRPGCRGQQRTDVLLLSPKATVAALPDLEVASHEVQCGHAATIGRPDPEKLYYMESRGLDRAEAIRLYAEGFLNGLEPQKI